MKSSEAGQGGGEGGGGGLTTKAGVVGLRGHRKPRGGSTAHLGQWQQGASQDPLGVERLAVGERQQGGSLEDTQEDTVLQVREIRMGTWQYRKRAAPNQ